MARVIIAGINLRRLGFVVSGITRSLEPASASYTVTQLPGRMGVITATDVLVSPREITIEGVFVANSTAARLEAERVLSARLARGRFDLVIDDGTTTRTITASLSGRVQLEPVGRLFRTRGSRLALTLVCHDATWRAEEPTLVGLSGTEIVLPHWEAATDFVAYVHGPATGAVLRWRNAGGTVTSEMQLGNLTSSQYLVIDGLNETVDEYTDGGLANGLARIGDDPFPPRGVCPSAGNGQTVQLTSGVGYLWLWRRWT